MGRGERACARQAGASVIATTSAGMAWSLGYADGEQVPRDELVAACARICRVAHVPVSVDIERGFGRSTAEVCELVRALVDLGVVGVNIEDGVSAETRRLLPPQALCERIGALRALAMQTKLRLFINARTDVYLAAHDDPATRFEQAVQRARLYASAGADGIFVPGMDQLDEVTRFARAVELPLNIYAGYAGVPTIEALAAAGVRRISLGCGPLQSALGLLGRIAVETLTQGRYDAMTSGMATASELNRLFPPPQPQRGMRFMSMTKQDFEAQRQFVDTPSGRIAYVEQGTGPVALFVHGVLLNGFCGGTNSPHLGDMRRCIAVDLLAHGATEIEPQQDVSSTANADDARRSSSTHSSSTRSTSSATTAAAASRRSSLPTIRSACAV